MLYFCGAKPESSGCWTRPKCDFVFIGCFAFHGYTWSRLPRSPRPPDFWTLMVFWQPMFRAEISIAVGTLKGKNLFGAAVLTFHCSSLANAVRFFLTLQFKCLFGDEITWLNTRSNEHYFQKVVGLPNGGVGRIWTDDLYPKRRLCHLYGFLYRAPEVLHSQAQGSANPSLLFWSPSSFLARLRPHHIQLNNKF